MQSKGAIKFVAIILLLASIWQLSFTFVSNKQVENAEKYAEQAVAAAVKADSTLSAEEQEALRSEANRFYLDSISSQKIYFGYTFKEVQEKSINLGLDLKGGMNVMLQVQMQDLVRALAVNPCDEFEAALSQATARTARKTLLTSSQKLGKAQTAARDSHLYSRSKETTML